MNCQEVMELMQRQVDGDLNEQETSLLRNHVGHCPDCAAMLLRLAHLSKGLEQLPRVVPPYSLVDAILPELGKWDTEAAETGVTSPKGRRTARTRRTWINRVSAVVALGVVVGLLLVNGPFSGKMGSSQQDAASMPESAANKEFAPLAADSNSSIMDQSSAASSASPSPSAGTAPRESARTFKKEISAGVPQPKPSAGKAETFGMKQGPGDHPGVSPSETADRIAQASPDSAVNNVNKGLAVNPSGPASEPPSTNMGIQPVKEEAASPDGKWKAVLTDGALQVFSTDNGNLVYDQAPDQGKRSGLVWSEDGKALDYTYTDAEGNQSQMYLQVPEMKEFAR